MTININFNMGLIQFEGQRIGHNFKRERNIYSGIAACLLQVRGHMHGSRMSEGPYNIPTSRSES